MEGESISRGRLDAGLGSDVLSQALPSRVNAVWTSSPWFGRVVSRVVPRVTVTGSRPGN